LESKPIFGQLQKFPIDYHKFPCKELFTDAVKDQSPNSRRAKASAGCIQAPISKRRDPAR
jgi:hypothetical protein